MTDPLSGTKNLPIAGKVNGRESSTGRRHLQASEIRSLGVPLQ
jgi:hypothetical protein